MLSLRGNVWDGGVPLDDTKALRQVVKGGNLPKKEKKEIIKKLDVIEKAEEKLKRPAADLRAMYGND